MRHRHHWRHGWGGSFGWWGDWGPGRFFGPGEVRLALLSLLSEGPRHGYELMKELENRSGGTYRASPGTVYPTLQQLEDEGLVVSESRDGKRIYRLTSEGGRALEEESEAVARIWRRAEAWGEWGEAAGPEAWRIMGPAVRVVKAAMRAVGGVSRDAERVERVRDILDLTAEELEELDARD